MQISRDFIESVVENIHLYLQDKGVACSVEELMEVLETSNVAVKKVSLASAATRKVSSLAEGEGCIYSPSRGPNQDVLCNKEKVEGYDYCKTCLKKPVVIKKLSGVVPVKKERAVPLKSVTSRPLTPFSFKKTVVQEEKPSLNIVPIEDNPGYYHSPSHNFILFREPNDTYVVIGYGEESVERSLTEEETKEALASGFRIKVSE